jgi:hypothetical protein
MSDSSSDSHRTLARMVCVALTATATLFLAGAPCALVSNVSAETLTERWTTAGSPYEPTSALAGDGTTMILGEPDERFGGSDGRAEVLARSGDTWVTQAVLQPAESQWFGRRVAISADGDTAMVLGNGMVWVFVRTGSSWTQQAELTPSEGYLGAIALSADGNTALIQEDPEEEGNSVRVFTRTGSTWQRGKELTAGEGSFGAVALSADGNTALFAGEIDEHATGTAWVFTQTGSDWAQSAKLTVSAGTIDSVALSASGDTALLGGEESGGETGAAWAFARSGSSWEQSGTPLSSGAAEPGASEARFGDAVALSTDGDTALVGGPHDYLFARSSSAWEKEEQAETKNDLTAVAISGDGDTALLGGGSGDEKRVSVMARPVPGPPEFGRCVRVAGNGRFNRPTCVKVSRAARGGYEWDPGVLRGRFSLGLHAGDVILETTERSRVTCQGAVGTGEYLGSKQVTNIVLDLTGCESEGHACATEGDPAGEIETGHESTFVSKRSVVRGYLGWLNAAKRKAALDLYEVGGYGPTLLQYSCAGGASVAVDGSLLVPIAGSRMSESLALDYKAKGGVQADDSLEGEPGYVLSAMLEPPALLGVSAHLLLTSEEPLEINPAV